MNVKLNLRLPNQQCRFPAKPPDSKGCPNGPREKADLGMDQDNEAQQEDREVPVRENQRNRQHQPTQASLKLERNEECSLLTPSPLEKKRVLVGIRVPVLPSFAYFKDCGPVVVIGRKL